MSIHSLSRSNPSTLEDLEDWNEEDRTLSITDKVGYSILVEADDRLQSLVKQGVWTDIKSVVLSELSNELDHYLLFYCRLKQPHGLNTRAQGSRTIRIIVESDVTDHWICPEYGYPGSRLYLVDPSGPDPVEWLLGAMINVLTAYQEVITQHNSPHIWGKNGVRKTR